MRQILFPDEKILESKNFEIYQDWEVPIPAFFIIASKKKIRSFMEFSREEAGEFIDLVVRIRKGMKEVLGIEHAYFFQNEDSTGFFHFWVFPRLPWMQKFGKKIQSVRPIMNYAKQNMVKEPFLTQVKETARRMREHFKNSGF